MIQVWLHIFQWYRVSSCNSSSFDLFVVLFLVFLCVMSVALTTTRSKCWCWQNVHHHPAFCSPPSCSHSALKSFSFLINSSSVTSFSGSSVNSELVVSRVIFFWCSFVQLFLGFFPSLPHLFLSLFLVPAPLFYPIRRNYSDSFLRKLHPLPVCMPPR